MSLFKEVIRYFNKEKIRYLLIGRQAVMLYGAPLFSFDYDFWVHPEDKRKTYEILEERLDFEPSYPVEVKRPMISFYSESGEKVDIFFVRKITNKEGETLDIEGVLQRSLLVKDRNFSIRVPEINDLIALKKMGKRPKDLEDIEYLKLIRARIMKDRKRV